MVGEFLPNSLILAGSNGAIIEELYELFRKYVSEADFMPCKGQWGFRGSEGYLKKESMFLTALRNFARCIPLGWHEGDLYRYDGRIYVPVEKGLVRQAYNRLLEYLGIFVMIGNTKAFEQYFLDVVRYYNQLQPRFDVVAFTNGVLDLRDYTFHEFAEKYHCTYMHPYRYNPAEKCYKWQSFLREVLPDKNQRLVLQMFLGLGLIERGTVYNPFEGKERAKVELCLILIGAGANGKSVIYQTAMGIFGRDRISGVDYDELTASGDEGMRARRLLRGAIFNWSSDSETRTFGKKRSGVFKRIVSGEPVTDRKIGGDVQENFTMPYLIFNLNELPNPDEGSFAFIRRLQYISFDVVIPKERQNKSLAFELQSEYPGIFNWVVRGAKEIRRRKFVFPDSEGNRRQVLLTIMKKDPVAAWVKVYNIRPVPDANNELYEYVRSADVIEYITAFCEENGVEAPSIQKMGTDLRHLGFYKKRYSEGYRYQVYGCSAEKMKIPVAIGELEFDTSYESEKGTYIDDED